MNKKHDVILKILVEKLKYLNYSQHTISIYKFYVEEFLNEVNKYHQHLTSDDFSHYLLNYEFSSISKQNQVVSSLKFFYTNVLNKKYAKIDFKRPKPEKKLPQVIEKEFILDRISRIKNIKHKAILSLGFSVGLRVSEVINLKVKDIDSTRMIITIRQAKGRKDRIVPLSENILQILREYYKQYKPKEYLFNGQFSLKYTATSCNKLVKNYLGEKYHFHLLRHSCFTSLLEEGTDIRIIQRLAGHSSTRTTEVYTHVSNKLLSMVPLPI